MNPSLPLPARRACLRAAACLPLALALPRPASAGFWDQPRELWLQRPATGEALRAVYWADGALQPAGYRQLVWLLRDAQAGAAAPIDLRLLDVLRGTQGWLQAAGRGGPLVITSGYRTAPTNEALEGAARDSLHRHGRAVDGRVPGVPGEYLARLALYLRGGGVGLYIARDFIHWDTGPVRAWAGGT